MAGGEVPTELERGRGWGRPLGQAYPPSTQAPPSQPASPNTEAWGQYLYEPLLAAAVTQAPAIQAGVQPPELIKEMGMEVVEISGGKLKITGVMGNSWADRARLQPKDIVLSFNGKRIRNLKHFQDLVQQAPPEKDYSIKIMRGDRVKSLRVTVGEGEMEGFTPIVPVAYMSPAGSGPPAYAGHRCANCGRPFGPVCPGCGTRLLHPVR